MLYVSISDETSKVKGKRKDEIMGENVGMISNGVTQRSHRTHGLRALIGGAQPYPWLVGPCGSAIKTGGGRGHELQGLPLPSTPPTLPYRSRVSARPRETPPPPHSPLTLSSPPPPPLWPLAVRARHCFLEKVATPISLSLSVSLSLCVWFKQ